VPVFKEIRCKSVLSRSQISGVDYSINPYVGCEHACAYCYARFMGQRTGHSEDWGEFVDIKINAPQVLSRELTRSKRGNVLLSSVTDPYQPLEGRYELTRKILKHLLDYDYPVSILTKSALVERDIDLLRRFTQCQVGATVVALNEKVRRAFEPLSSPSRERLSALRELGENGIQTYLFLGPILPGFSEEDLKEILDECERIGIDHMLIDRLNIKYGNWSSIARVIDTQFPERRDEWEKALFFRSGYFEQVKQEATTMANERKIRLVSCY